MVKPKLLYVFRRPVTHLLNKVKTGQVPEDVFYGLTRMYTDFDVMVTDKVFSHTPLLITQQLLNRFVLQFLDIGFSLFPTILLLRELRNANLIFATVDTYGLPIALFKKMGLIRTPLVFNTIGLYDGLLKKHNRQAISFCQNILQCVDHFVSGGSFQECQKLALLLKLPVNKFVFIPFGIDTHFWQPQSLPEEDYVLAIGADPSRDWYLYQKVASQLPHQRFVIVTYMGLVKTPMPKNVSFRYNLTYTKLRELIGQAKCILILSKHNYHFAGQSTAFRAMSSGKPVIFTNTPGVEEYKVKHGKDCLLVPPDDVNLTIKAITTINASPQLRNKIGKNARSTIQSKYNLENYACSLNELTMNVHNTHKNSL